MKNDEIKALASILAGSKPMAYAMKEDGSMVVINAIGQKFIFTPLQVKEASKPTDKVSK